MAQAETSRHWQQSPVLPNRYNSAAPWDERRFLERAKRALSSAFGSRLAAVVLFGSRARGDASEESDYDIAVFIHDLSALDIVPYFFADLSTVLMFESGGRVAQFVALDASDRQRHDSMLLENIRREGRDL